MGCQVTRLLLAVGAVWLCQQTTLGAPGEQTPEPGVIQVVMYPGIGKLPMSPIPYDLPNPQYPHRLEIKPVHPSTAVIPGVIFRPPSEILRNFGELKADQPAETNPGVKADAPPPASGSPAGANRPAPASASPGPADPNQRPTRRQPLGW